MNNRHPIPIVRSVENLSELAKRINSREKQAGKDLLEHARQQGEDLIVARSQCGERKFAPWLRENFEFHKSTAYDYITIAENWDSVISRVTLPIGPTEALRLIQEQEHLEQERGQHLSAPLADEELEDPDEEKPEEAAKEEEEEQEANIKPPRPASFGEDKYVTLKKWESYSAEKQEKLLTSKGDAKFNSQGNNENIEWAMWSWNPITGCLHNCPYCYARDIAERFYEQKFAPSLWPGRLFAPQNTKFPADKIEDATDPWRKRGLGNVFTCSMADLFGRWVPTKWIEAVLREVRAAPQWTFLFLTKFPIRMAEFDFPENVWVGTTVDCQARVANAEKAFRKITAGVKWLSVEPLIEPLKFDDLGAFQWLVLGGSSRSSQTPEWTPPLRWVVEIEEAAVETGVPFYEKSNLGARHERIRQYPGDEPYTEPIKAPKELLYLIPKDQREL